MADGTEIFASLLKKKKKEKIDTRTHIPTEEALCALFHRQKTQAVAFYSLLLAAKIYSLSSSEWNFPVLHNVEIMNFGKSKST